MYYIKTISKKFIPAEINYVKLITNNVENWINLFESYTNVDIIYSDSDYVKFRLTTIDGDSWVSERRNISDFVVKGERLSPMYPFKFMHIKWTYESVDNGTLMIWEQEFEPDASLPKEAERKMYEHIMNHSKIEMSKIYNYIMTR